MKISRILPKIMIPTGLLYLFVLSACQPPATENRLEQIAKGCCECTSQLVQLNQQAAKSPAEADFKAMEDEYKKTKDCLTTVTNHLGGRLNAEELKELEKQLQLKCPPLATQQELLRELLGE